MTPAVIVFFIGSYMTRDLRDAGRHISRCGGSAATCVFVLLNYWGVELSFRVSVIVTLVALAVLDRVLDQRDSVRRLHALGAEHRRRSGRRAGGAAGRRRRVPAVRLERRARGAAVRRVAVPRHRSSCRSRPRNPSIRRRDMPKGLIFGMFDADGLGAADHVPERGRSARRSKARCTARSRWRLRPSRCSTASASSTARASRSCWRSSR